jgi:hypothetical protein
LSQCGILRSVGLTYMQDLNKNDSQPQTGQLVFLLLVFTFLRRNEETRNYTAKLLRFLDQTLLDTHTHTHSVGLLWMSDQLAEEVASYTKQNKHEINIHVFSGIRIRN